MHGSCVYWALAAPFATTAFYLSVYLKSNYYIEKSHLARIVFSMLLPATAMVIGFVVALLIM
ncbi:hypothetical protein CRI94_01605 [Longibacter salinarum]|uniref:Uncharacterized protein n=1 Tax=Longibacter salinarum TaxID=1850348 RepID=A0A2A8D297_9BACT|nr:hypothetical protein CRI94_01605 [Longibacter salinarum]